MDTRTAQDLRERIADYRRLRTMTWDKQALERIDRIIAETEERLRELEATRPRIDGAAPLTNLLVCEGSLPLHFGRQRGNRR
jgi:hypothetical protein